MDAIIMLDSGFLKRKFYTENRRILAVGDLQSLTEKLIQRALNKSCTDISYRVYFYDCPPSKDKVVIPLTNKKVLDFEKCSSFAALTKFLADVKQLPYFAVREGVLSFEGWKLNPKTYDKMNGTIAVSSSDFIPNLKQKGVDTKIGLDMAWISYEKITPNIILVSGDSDFIPAIKTARRSGVFVHLFTLNHGIKQGLKECVDVLHTETLNNL